MIIDFADPMTRTYALQVHPGSGNTCYLWNVVCATAEECSVVTPFRQSRGAEEGRAGTRSDQGDAQQSIETSVSEDGIPYGDTWARLVDGQEAMLPSRATARSAVFHAKPSE